MRAMKAMKIWAWLLIGIGGCVGPEAPRGAEEEARGAEDPGAFVVRLRPETGTLAFLEARAGRAEPLAAQPEQQASAVRRWLLARRGLLGLAQDSDLDYEESSRDGLGMRHLRYRQQRDGVPVLGSAIWVHLDEAGALQRVQGFTVPMPKVGAPLRFALEREAARQLALAALRAREPDAELRADEARAGLWPGAELIPVYEVEVQGQGPRLPLWRVLRLDARGASGAIVDEEDRLAWLSTPAQGSGVGALGARRELSISQGAEGYSLVDLRRGGGRTAALGPGQRLPGRTVQSKDRDRWDEEGPGRGVAVDVHAHLASLWDYFAAEHGRYGVDGKGHGVTAVVHAPLAAAVFDGRSLIFGESPAPLGAALDVVAHEYVHALVHSAGGLRRGGEGGALEEGMADVLACLIEQALAGAAGPGAWTIGEAVLPAGLIADLTAPPPSDRADPAGRSATERQRVGYAGYLMAQRLGGRAAAAVFLRLITTYLFRNTRFSDAVEGLLAAARDLHGARSQEVRALAALWRGLGFQPLEPLDISSEPAP